MLTQTVILVLSILIVLIFVCWPKKIPKAPYVGCLYSPTKEHYYVTHFDFPFHETDCYWCRTGPFNRNVSIRVTGLSHSEIKNLS
jgi:hypothetical protein